MFSIINLSLTFSSDTWRLCVLLSKHLDSCQSHQLLYLLLYVTCLLPLRQIYTFRWNRLWEQLVKLIKESSQFSSSTLCESQTLSSSSATLRSELTHCVGLNSSEPVSSLSFTSENTDSSSNTPAQTLWAHLNKTEFILTNSGDVWIKMRQDKDVMYIYISLSSKLKVGIKFLFLKLWIETTFINQTDVGPWCVWCPHNNRNTHTHTVLRWRL